jgi:hypothetical protein
MMIQMINSRWYVCYRVFCGHHIDHRDIYDHHIDHRDIYDQEVVTITNENRVSNDRIVQGHKVVDIEVGRPTDKLYPFFYHCKSLCSCCDNVKNP